MDAPDGRAAPESGSNDNQLGSGEGDPDPEILLALSRGDMMAVPNQRSFSLNSDEAYEALCPRPDRPWIPNGSLPREPRPRALPVIVETRRR